MAKEKVTRDVISVPEFFRMFPDEKSANAWFVNTRWPEGIRCPRCDSNNVLEKTKHPTMPYQCRKCRKFFSVRTGTLMQGSNLPSRTWLLAMYIMTTSVKGASSMRMHRDLKVTYKTAWFLAHRLRETWEKNHDPFEGPVEFDEMYIGGLEKNKHANKRKFSGGGSAGKETVIGAFDHATGQIRVEHLPRKKSGEIKEFVYKSTIPGSIVWTDEAMPYRHIKGYDHQYVIHKSGEYVDSNNGATTNSVESFWAKCKRGYHGTYHHMSPKHLHRYLSEFEGRHNARNLDTIDQLRSIAMGMVGKRLKYADLTAKLFELKFL